MEVVDFSAIGSGVIVGFALGLLGGGGSIFAVPLLLYVAGVRSMHVAIGTSSVAVAVSALANLTLQGARGVVKWPCASVFATAGLLGAAAGAAAGKRVDAALLEFAFALVMLAVAVAMFRPRAATGDPDTRINPAIAVRLVGVGTLAGFLSGFFGVGGGFLIVPAMMLGSGMTMINAVGSSLLPVSVFASTTAVSYAASGLVDWPIAGWFIAGGILGGIAGVRSAAALAGRRQGLNRVFAGATLLVAGYVLWRASATP